MFDDYGLVTQTTDPDHGTTSYQYNSFGQLVATTDANTETVTELHDGLGRMVTRLASDETSAWIWDAATNGLGKLARTTSAAGVTKEFFYDGLSRVTSEVTTLDGESVAIQKTYKPAGAQGVGRLDTLTYPDGFAVQYNYDAHGRATQINKLDSGASIWMWTQADSAGRITNETFGNGVLTTRAFSDAQDGVLSSIVSTTPSAAVPQGIVQSLSFNYDTNRNLTGRADARPGNQHFETFCYDDLNRLTDGAIDAAVTCGSGSLYHYTYQPDGNIASSLELGTYTYNPTRPHAVASAGSSVYRYDSRGDQIVRPHPTATGAPHRTVIYTSFHKPMAYLGGLVTTGNGSKGARCSSASQSSGGCLCTTVDGERICSEDATTFDYDANQVRTRKRSAVGHTIYVSGLYEKKRIKATNTTEQRYLIASPEHVVAVVTRTRPNGNTPDTINYVHVDHAGSTDTLTDEAGVVVERHSYDPFGQQRSTDWSTLPQSSTAALGVPIGFTGHEEDAEARLVNMRGRIYDPRLGRFLSPDPRAPSAGSQSWNRYSYVYNNPLNWIDPSGFEGELPMAGGLPPIGALPPLHQSYAGWSDPIGNVNAVDMSYNPATGAIQFDFSSEAPNSDSAGWSNIQRTWDQIRQLVGIGSPWAFSSPQDDPVAAAITQVSGMFDAAMKAVQNATPLEAAQVGLSVLGFVPGPVGAAANLITAGIETYHGNYGAAAMLAAGAILPGVAMVAELGAASRAAEGVAVIGELSVKAGSVEKAGLAAEGAGKVLLDSNVVVQLGKDATAGGRLAAGERGVVSYVTAPELRNAVANGNLRGVPRALEGLEVVGERPSLDAIINFRGELARTSGRFGDGIIGAQAVEFGIPLVTNDAELAAAVRAAGGIVR